mmetsp:Transcript_45757/g.131998  ORF Transcript_45757/g.131998 Transcript_45757/m.131998 type:complete len:243 (+) Transcript_45757:965-1693(+)
MLHSWKFGGGGPMCHSTASAASTGEQIVSTCTGNKAPTDEQCASETRTKSSPLIVRTRSARPSMALTVSSAVGPTPAYRSHARISGIEPAKRTGAPTAMARVDPRLFFKRPGNSQVATFVGRRSRNPNNLFGARSCFSRKGTSNADTLGTSGAWSMGSTTISPCRSPHIRGTSVTHELAVGGNCTKSSAVAGDTLTHLSKSLAATSGDARSRSVNIFCKRSCARRDRAMASSYSGDFIARAT